MEAHDYPFRQIVDGTKQFVIPVFQRDYSWTEEQCEQLWNDVIRIAGETNGRRHFLGSLVVVSTGDSSPGLSRWQLIDGQQRFATLTLLLVALRNFMLDSGWTGKEHDPTAEQVEAYFLKNVYEKDKRRYKLALRRHDYATLSALLDREEYPQVVSERIRDNYEWFKSHVAEVDPAVVYRGVDRLVIVQVTLDARDDDPQLIFESLNSTGIALSQSDLIRNFLLMRQPEEPEQTRLYECYWSKIEGLFRGSENMLDSFLRDYLALATQASKQERADQVYFAFRRAFGQVGSELGSLDTFLGELLRFARYHAAFSVGRGAVLPLREPFARLRRLVDVPATLVMQLFHCYDRLRTLSGAEFVEAVELVESYVLRRAICGEQTRGYWQVFAGVALKIDPERPLETLKVELARMRGTYRFPSDEDFRRALEESDIYGKRVCHDLLDRFENHGSREPTDTSRYSIEHIMPQNERLSPEWRAMLGENWRDLHGVWLHRLGNLTLTSYNSTYSDHPFEEKKTVKDGFNDSSVRLNKYVRERKVWTEREMEERGRDLAGEARAIWPGLHVEQQLIDAASRRELRERAKRNDVSKVKMTPKARGLFNALRPRVKNIDAEIIELAEANSVSFHAASFFLEVIPRASGLTLLLDLDFNEVVDTSGIAQDASQWKYFKSAAHGGGVTIAIYGEADIEKAMPVIRQAYTVSAG